MVYRVAGTSGRGVECVKQGVRRSFCKSVWRLLKGYWMSKEKWRALGLLGVVIVLNFAAVYVLVLLNQWYNTFYNALQNYDQASFWPLIGQFGGLALIHIAIAVYVIYLRQMLQIKWRQWMTAEYLTNWLQKQTYYKMQLLNDATDNPDQRISEDINQFTTLTLGLALGFLKQVTMLGAFIVILWNLSGVISVPIGDREFTVYGYMVWLSIAYAVVGTYLTAKIGNPLVRLNYDQQRYEADFRFNMVRVRENSESVAFFGGEAVEHKGFLGRFSHVFTNYWSLMKYEKRLTWFTSSYGQLAVIFPLLLAAPRYFSGAMQLGGLIQTSSAFGKVQDALSFFVDSYTSIAQWIAVVKRLTGFVEHMEDVNSLETKVTIANANIKSLVVKDLNVALPNHTVLVKELSLQIEAGDKILITGASGCGKSTLLRTISGIWPFGEGSILIPQGELRLFLPQKPYLPLGTLRETLLYPSEVRNISDAEIKTVLDSCNLGDLKEKLDDTEDWARILSLGEQQRIAFARVFIIKPKWVFLDEATSALDEATEQSMYQMMIKMLPNTTIISIGHRSTLLAYHQKRLQLASNGTWNFE